MGLYFYKSSSILSVLTDNGNLMSHSVC